MLKALRQKIISLRMDISTIAMSIIAAFSLSFFCNPLHDTPLSIWDRSFCEATLANIDIGHRIFSLSLLTCILFPVLTFIFFLFYSWFWKERTTEKKVFLAACIPLGILSLAGYTLKYWEAPVSTIATAAVSLSILGQIAIAATLRIAHRDFGFSRLQVLFRDTFASLKRTEFFQKHLKGIIIASGVSLTGTCAIFPFAAIELGIPFCAEIALAFAALFLLAHLVIKKMEEDIDRHFEFLFEITSISFFITAASVFSKAIIPFLSRKSDIYAANLSSILPDFLTIVIFFAFISVLGIIRKNRDIAPERIPFLFVSLLVFPITFSLIFPIHCCIGAGFIAILSWFIPKIPWEKLKKAFYLWAWFPSFFIVVQEILFTLCEKGFIGNHFRLYLSLASVLFAAATIFFTKKPSLQNILDSKGERFGYLGALASLLSTGFLHITYNYSWGYESYANLYEMGNRATALKTILHGKLPFFDYFSAHALSDIWTNILHGIIHHNSLGTIISPYGGLSFVLGALILFAILKKIFQPFFAFAIIALFPLDTLGLKAYSICLIAILLHLWIQKKESAASFLIYWLLIAANAFYVYDEGIALGLASIFCTSLLFAVQRDFSKLRKFLFAGFGAASLILLFFGLYCIISEISFFDRIREWYALSVQSTNSWATEKFAHLKMPSYLYAYLILPMAAALILATVSAHCIKHRQINTIAAITIIFSLSQILCIPRGIIFHNIAVCNGLTGRLMNYSHYTLAFFALFVVTQLGINIKFRKYIWLLVLSGCIWGNNAIVTYYLPNNNSSLYNRAANYSIHQKEAQTVIKKERFAYDDSTQKFVQDFKTLFDHLLQKDETFIDFANITSLYAFTERENPFYTAQTPSLLSTTYSQEQFLQQAKKYRIPLAITGNGRIPYIEAMWDIPHTIRYYRIAEYIYINYVPLIKIRDFTIWCQKPLRSKFLEKLNSLDNNRTYIHVDEDYRVSAYESFDLKWIPFLWANFDKYKAIDNPVIDTGLLKEDAFFFKGSKAIRDTTGKYVSFNIHAANDAPASITFFEESVKESEYRYSFSLKKGTYDYIIRASGDYSWYAHDINALRIDCKSCSISGVRILEGD